MVVLPLGTRLTSSKPDRSQVGRHSFLLVFDRDPIPHIAPLRMMIHLLGLERDQGHERERGRERSEGELPLECFVIGSSPLRIESVEIEFVGHDTESYTFGRN